MPELPEVETIKNELAPYIVGRRIASITVLDETLVREPSPDELRARVAGQEVKSLDRRGKFMLFSLASGDILAIHLRMAGTLILSTDSAETPTSTRAIIDLDDGTRIFFRDPRKFAIMELVRDKTKITSKLGPEPLEDSFTPDVLASILAGRSAPIKALLLEQDLIAGIGNMYADEALFMARIHPLRKGSSLTREEIERLHHAIRTVLKEGIERKGASIVNYFRPHGEKGAAQTGFKVAHGRNKTCPECGGPVKRITVRGRGTYFCPCCQTLPPEGRGRQA